MGLANSRAAAKVYIFCFLRKGRRGPHIRDSANQLASRALADQRREVMAGTLQKRNTVGEAGILPLYMMLAAGCILVLGGNISDFGWGHTGSWPRS